MSLSDWDDHLTRWLVRPPFRDEAGDKGLFSPLCRAQPHRVQHLELSLPHFPVLHRPLRIAFLSDFHVGSHTEDVPRLRNIVAGAASFDPDLALYGGDFVNMIPFGGGRVPPRVIARELGRLRPRLGAFAVTGNHDRNYGEMEVAAALRAAGITVLFDETHEVVLDGAMVDVLGIQDARQERPGPRALLQGLRPERPTIVLAHDPVWFRDLPVGPFLLLAGHTHGGQIRLPMIGPIRNASHAPLRWSYGLIKEQGRWMYVTGGLGSSGIPLRIGMPPEYAIIDLNGAR